MSKSKYDLGAAAHPAADRFPLLSDDVLAVLAAGKARTRIVEDLERLQITIANAVSALGRKDGE